MRPLDECLLGRKKNGVVTDGLQPRLDARDDFTVTDSSNDSGGIVGQSAITFLDRVDGEEIQITPSL